MYRSRGFNFMHNHTCWHTCHLPVMLHWDLSDSMWPQCPTIMLLQQQCFLVDDVAQKCTWSVIHTHSHKITVVGQFDTEYFLFKVVFNWPLVSCPCCTHFSYVKLQKMPLSPLKPSLVFYHWVPVFFFFVVVLSLSPFGVVLFTVAGFVPNSGGNPYSPHHMVMLVMTAARFMFIIGVTWSAACLASERGRVWVIDCDKLKRKWRVVTSLVSDQLRLFGLSLVDMHSFL